MKTQNRLANAALRLARTLSNVTGPTGRTGIPKGGWTATVSGKPGSIFGLIVKNAGLSISNVSDATFETLSRLVGIYGPDFNLVYDAVHELVYAANVTKNPRRDLPARLRTLAKVLRTANLRKPYTRASKYATKAVGTLNIVTPVTKKTVQTLKSQFNTATPNILVTGVQPTAN